MTTFEDTANKVAESVDAVADKISEKTASSRAHKLRIATQETRHRILINILAHPKNLPSLEELAYMSSKSKSTMYQHLKKLIDAGFVKEIQLPSEERQRDLPHKFYGITERGMNFLEELDLIPEEDHLYALYDRTEKPEQIKKYENAPRPEGEKYITPDN